MLQARAAEAMSYFLDPNDPGSPPKYTEDYGPTLLNQIQGLAGYYEEMMDDDRAELERLQKRVAELNFSLDMERNSISERLLVDREALALLAVGGWLSPTEAAQLLAQVAELESHTVHMEVGTMPDTVKEVGLVIDEMDIPQFCGDCGHQLTVVRPGKWQCDHCDEIHYRKVKC